MRFGSLLLSLYAALAPLAVFARSSTGDSVLVVLEPELKKEDYSILFKNLESRGYELTFRAPSDKTPQVFVYDKPQFSHVLMLAPTTKSFAEDLSPQSLFYLLKEHPTTNIVVALSPKNTPLSAFAAEFSLGLPLPNTPLISHFPARKTPHTTVFVSPTTSSNHVLTNGLSTVVFEGQAHMVGDNPLLVPILYAPAESFSSDTTEDRSGDVVFEAADKGGEGLWAGSKMSLVTGFQATSSARVTFVGGVKVFSDEFAKMEVAPGKVSGNAQLSKDITAWTFQESLVLRVDNATHHLASDSSRIQKDRYTTNDRLTFTMELSQFDPTRGSYVPKSDVEDMQLAFTMLDPHVRTSLKPVAGQPGTYSVTFRAPDRHGVYKFIVDYKRKGLTPVHVSMLVPIVPPRHDGYPRFLSAAWPYYAGAISTSLGFILFCVIYLGGEVEEERTRKAKGKGKVE
ncbi:oligosaccharyl transferase glycoprotein complex, beta subunit [Tulasnella sp. JGI-2019a]|nr:oligosaccharyl transferase glycoprotein complex, beta subunit [Tulasnella sp. JGI-2019a]